MLLVLNLVNTLGMDYKAGGKIMLYLQKPKAFTYYKESTQFGIFFCKALFKFVIEIFPKLQIVFAAGDFFDFDMFKIYIIKVGIVSI